MASSPDNLLNTILGRGSVFFGDLQLDGMVRVDGTLIGSLKTSGRVVVGESARCECSIRAKSAVVGGVVKGDIVVDDHLRLLRGSVVIGNIFAPKFEAEDGVVIHGDCKFSGKVMDETAVKAFIFEHGGILETPRERLASKVKAHPFTVDPNPS